MYNEKSMIKYSQFITLIVKNTNLIPFQKGVMNE